MKQEYRKYICLILTATIQVIGFPFSLIGYIGDLCDLFKSEVLDGLADWLEDKFKVYENDLD